FCALAPALGLPRASAQTAGQFALSPMDLSQNKLHNPYVIVSCPRLSFLRRENEYFSKRAGTAGVLSLRKLGYTTLDYGAVRRAVRCAGCACLRRLFRADTLPAGARQIRRAEQNSHRAARPGQYAPR